jgi:hypothetical protein
MVHCNKAWAGSGKSGEKECGRVSANFDAVGEVAVFLDHFTDVLAARPIGSS